MAKWFRVHTGFTEDLSSAPNTHIGAQTACKSSSGDAVPLASPGTSTHVRRLSYIDKISNIF